MSTAENEGGETWYGLPESLTEPTDDLIRARARQIVGIMGIESDSQTAEFGPETQSNIRRMLPALGITEETPIIKRCLLPIEDRRLLPVYLRHVEGMAYLGIEESLISHPTLAAFKIYCDVGRDPVNRQVGDGIEFYLLEAGRLAPRAFIRDPVSGRVEPSAMTEAQGQDLLVVFKGILGE